MSKAVVIPECGRDIGRVKEEISLSPPEKKDGAMGLFSRFLRFDALGKKTSSPGSPISTEPPTTYYGVFIPCEIKKGPDEGIHFIQCFHAFNLSLLYLFDKQMCVNSFLIYFLIVFLFYIHICC